MPYYAVEGAGIAEGRLQCGGGKGQDDERVGLMKGCWQVGDGNTGSGAGR